MQFALLRLSQTAIPALISNLVAETVDATLQPTGQTDRIPITDMVTGAELIYQTLTQGQLDLFATNRKFRTMLSLSCMFCESVFPAPESLHEHLMIDHKDLVQKCGHHLIMLRWVIFQQNGCVCNPGVGWNVEHECLPILQSAMLYGERDRILLPFNYKASELVSLLDPFLEPSDVTRVALQLISRQIHLVAADDAVWAVLTNHCIICQASLDNTTFREHYIHTHQDIGVGPALVSQQVQKATWFEINDEDFILHFCVLLSQPVWRQRGTLSTDWPHPGEVRLNQHRREQRTAQCIVKLSALPDFKIVIIQSGLALLDDPWLASRLNYTCLFCHKLFFQPCQLVRHLHEVHNKWQYDAQRIHDILLDFAGDPCYFCDRRVHMTEIRGRCVPTFNVAVYISHGLNGHRDVRHLAWRHLWPPHPRLRNPQGRARSSPREDVARTITKARRQPRTH